MDTYKIFSTVQREDALGFKILLTTIFFLLAGCAESTDQPDNIRLMGAGDPDSNRSSDRVNTMARSHEITIDVVEDVLETGYEAVVSTCTELENCTLLNSSIDSGEYPRAYVRMRLLPESVPQLYETAASYGQVTRSQTSAEDLAKPIFDQEERLSMLRQYIADLKNLRTDAKNDVNALIRLASELAKTQSQLESAEGQRAHLQLRVDTEILSINLIVDQQRSFWVPVSLAIANFSGELSEGVASAFSGVAFILPWLFVLIPLLYLTRWLWRRTKGSSTN